MGGGGDPYAGLRLHWLENPRTSQRGKRRDGSGGGYYAGGNPQGHCQRLRRNPGEGRQAVDGSAIPCATASPRILLQPGYDIPNGMGSIEPIRA